MRIIKRFNCRDKYCLLDPSREEELICDGTVSVIYFEDGGIAQITHAGALLYSFSCIIIPYIPRMASKTIISVE